MTFKTSSNSWIIFKSALKRLKWLGILYGIIMFLDGPLSVWMKLGYQKESQGALWDANNLNILQLFYHPIQIMMNITIPILLGLVLFQYLQNEKQSTLLHSFPIKREVLYIQNLLAGLVMIWLPIILNGVLLYGVFSSFGITEGIWPNYAQSSMAYTVPGGQPAPVPIGPAFGHWIFFNLLMTSIFYIFTVFIGMLTGNFILQGALTYIGLVLPVGLYVLMKYNLWKLLFGYPREVNDKVFEWLSPLTAYLTQIERVLYNGMSLYAGYSVVAVILVVASIVLYKHRHAEAAGETLAAEWIRQLFKYGVAVCMALTLGIYFSEINDQSAAALYLGYLFGALLGYMIADMIAYKSFRFYERWKGMVIFVGILFLLIFSVKLDVYGFEKYVPEEAQVKGVMLGIFNNEGPSTDKALSEKDAIEKVLALHHQIIQVERTGKGLFDVTNNQITPRMQEAPNMFRSMDITYIMNSGKKVKRSYNVDLNQYKAYIKPVFDTQNAKKLMYSRLFNIEAGNIDKIEINNFHFNKNVRLFKAEEVEEALTALRKDILNVSYEAAIEGKVPIKANLDFYLKTGSQKNYETYSLPVYSEFTNLKAFLQKYDYQENLFVNPKDVSYVEIRELGKETSYQIQNEQAIAFLLDISSLEDEKMTEMRLQDQTGKGFKVYYGKVVLTNTKTMSVVFDSSPNMLKEIEEILDK